MNTRIYLILQASKTLLKTERYSITYVVIVTKAQQQKLKLSCKATQYALWQWRETAALSELPPSSSKLHTMLNILNETV